MPLNEDERRILEEIERGFYADDPDSARRIQSTTLPRYLARNCWWAAAGLLAGLVILVVGFASSPIIGIIGFLVMVASAVVLIQNLRRMSRFGLERVTQSMNNRNLGEAIEDAARRWRERFRGEDS